ncbi:substrate-binding and VWA domain-containing protein [Actinomadura sp. 9N407]|uniref:substrate-binding and VWA domain-containing protein n=1 Tax=Actinomadura sp. 9N407 TaxID=3375154 RepID=UPI00378BDA88
MRERPLVTITAAVGGLVLLSAVGVYAFSRIAGCAAYGAVTLDVAAAPDIAPAIAVAGERFNNARHRVDGECVRVRIRAADPAAMSRVLMGQSKAPSRPDVWIPDSTLWTSLVRTSTRGGRPFEIRPTSVAYTPVVLGMAKPGADSWNALLRPAAEAERRQLPDPSHSAVGMAVLAVAERLLADAPDRVVAFTSLARAIRESSVPTVNAAFTGGSGPVVATEQAILDHNRRVKTRQAAAVHPREGTLWLDYPFTITTDDGTRRRTARQFETALRGKDSKADIRAHGFRNDLKPPPQVLPLPTDVRRLLQSYARLSLPTRLLVLFDISGSMGEKVAPGVNRLQATAQVAQGGLQLLANDSELGIWAFSTELAGEQDWIEQVPMAPLGERIGSVTHRQRILSELGRLRVKRGGDTGLYDSLLAAFRMMKRTYRPEMVNTVLLFTDGRNEDDNGPSFSDTLADLHLEYDPARPVQVILQGYGDNVDVGDLEQLAKATRGIVQVARTPEESQRLLLEAMSRRVCTPNC